MQFSSSSAHFFQFLFFLNQSLKPLDIRRRKLLRLLPQAVLLNSNQRVCKRPVFLLLAEYPRGTKK